ncbi:hypothetical protein JQC92_08665 [Shewanella sp. 202IG2-18]|nr:hypothetical protein [Parashewanella hymeniacidonis]
MKKMGLDFFDAKLPDYLSTNEKNWACIIGHDVWIGDGVRIMNGVTIGNGAIIAAGAVVTKDVVPFSIVGGIPAIFIKNRFEDKVIQNIQNSHWWYKSLSELRIMSSHFSDAGHFK